MERVQVTLALYKDVMVAARHKHVELGFSDVGELVSTAVTDYLKRHEIAKMDAAMVRAANDPHYQQLLREIGDDFKYVDAEGLPEPY